MEARSRNLGFGFPDFPKATRSLRGRADHSMRNTSEGNEIPKDSCFFELLATVAGQLLQEQNEETLTARSLVDIESPKAHKESRHDGSCAYDARSCHKKDSDAAIRTNGEDIADNSTKYSKHARHLSDKGYEHIVANFRREDGLDPSSGQKMNTFFLEGSRKAHSSRKRKMEAALSCQGLPMASTINRSMRTSPKDRIASGSDHGISKVKGVFRQEMHPAHFADLRETNSVNNPECVPGQHCKGLRQEVNLLAPFPDMDSPLLVSSGSSEETPFPLDFKSYSTVAYESDRLRDVREEFSSWKVGDDDDNSSESTVRKSLLTRPLDIAYTRITKPRRHTNSTPRKRLLGVGFKRKCQDNEDGERINIEKTRVGKKKAGTLPLRNDDNEHAKNSSLGMLVDTNQEDGSKNQPLLSEREKSSSVLSSASLSKRDDSNVKLSIKSFMVPELMVVLPESATVANLKKAVMEAAMNLLSGGLCVRVLLQGKKVTDETESLLQAGISGGGNSLGFMLEPKPFPASTGVDDPFLVLSHNANQTSSRYPVLSKGSEINTDSYHVGPSEGLHEIDANSSGTEMQSATVSQKKDDTLVNDSNGFILPGQCALVLHASQMNSSPNGLAVIPFGQNSGSVGMNKRRIRRPFSVVEVEVLVQAVETLGTGRWRDVKLQAFPQAKHRTYVDLKDKWKTLVHTASIAPHQRRGEPVPQGLLDRVIQAHSYWTAQQAKQQSMETKVF